MNNGIDYKLIDNKRGTSNKMVAILVIASLLITIVGTWTVLAQINMLNTKMRTNMPHSDSGRVQMTLTPTSIPNTAGEVKLKIDHES
jgi:hypothetical protein